MRCIETTLGDGGVATVLLNRPDRLNALDFELVDTLRTELDALAGDAAVKAIVISGAGRAFSAGADLTALAPVPQADGRVDMGRQVSEAMSGHFGPMVAALMNFPKPVVSAVNGIAAGGGAGIALCADIVLAGREGKLKFVQTQQLGIVADLGATWLVQRVAGRQVALATMLLGETITAERAERLGLVWEVVDDDKLLSRAALLAAELGRAPAAAVRATRHLVDMAAGATFQQMMEIERVHLRDLASAPELLARVNAFMKK